MADPLKKVRPHEKLRIPAAAYNAFVDATQWVQKHQTGNDSEASRAHRSAGIILAKNKTGAKRARFHVMGIDDPIITPAANLDEFKNRVALKGVVPQEKHFGKFVILQEPLDPDGIGRAIVAGVTVARVRVITETDRFADIDEGQCDRLKTVPWGSTRILWKEAGLGIKWAVVRLGDRPKFAIFELNGTWKPGTGCSGSGSSGEMGGGEPDGWAKMENCRPVYFFTDSCTYAAAATEPTQTVWHVVGYPGQHRQQLIALHKATGLFPAKFGCGDWVWCHFNEQDGRWQVLDSYEDHWRFRLLTPLYRCDSALAKLVLYQYGRWCPVDLTFTVHDSVGIVCPNLCKCLPSASGNCNCEKPKFVPAGTYGMAKHYADSCRWEVLNLGEGCCDGTSGSSGSSSGSSGSSSSSGQSSSSGSSGSSGSGSSGSGSSGSGSGSSGSGSSGSGSSGSGGGGITIQETDIRCEDGKLNVYSRTVTINLSGGVLTKETGDWTLDHQAGCCCCDCCSGSSSGTSSSGYSGSSSGHDSSGSGPDSSGSGSGSSGGPGGPGGSSGSSSSSGRSSSGGTTTSSGDPGSSSGATSSGVTTGGGGGGSSSGSSSSSSGVWSPSSSGSSSGPSDSSSSSADPTDSSSSSSDSSSGTPNGPSSSFSSSGDLGSGSGESGSSSSS